jgi:hypothetical protein
MLVIDYGKIIFHTVDNVDDLRGDELEECQFWDHEAVECLKK